MGTFFKTDLDTHFFVHGLEEREKMGGRKTNLEKPNVLSLF